MVKKEAFGRFYGCHVSAAGGLQNAVLNGSALGVNSIQLHPSPPQRWNTKPFTPEAAERFCEARAASAIEKVFFHGVYLINLATPDEKKLAAAKLSLQYYLALADAVSSDGVIFHVGSNKDQDSEEAGLRQAAAAIDEILKKSKGKSRLLLEVAAGSGRIIGDRMEELRAIYDRIEDKARVGFALDTQHMWASGYDLAGSPGKLVQEIDAVFGLERVAAIHLNDSKSDCGSRLDRHENLGQGKIGADALKKFINHPHLKEIPVLLETPALRDMSTAREEVIRLRDLVRG